MTALTECPVCDTTGAEVYLAEAHPTFCTWMMHNLNRCNEHDELLRPDEPTCPRPDVPSDWRDPHGRRQEPIEPDAIYDRSGKRVR